MIREGEGGLAWSEGRLAGEGKGGGGEGAGIGAGEPHVQCQDVRFSKFVCRGDLGPPSCQASAIIFSMNLFRSTFVSLLYALKLLTRSAHDIRTVSGRVPRPLTPITFTFSTYFDKFQEFNSL